MGDEPLQVLTGRCARCEDNVETSQGIRRRSWGLAALCALSLSACATQPGTILNPFSLAGGQSITTDSRQRIVTANPLRGASRPGLVNPQQIVCAEPSPDVAIALANSFGTGLSVLGYGSGSMTGATAEGMAQLAERTVAVQLLRDQMYRACEAFANGAISGTTYSLIMSKNNNAMITLLLGETAGGAFGRTLAGLGTAANAEARAAVEGLTAAGDAVKQASEDLKTAEARVRSAEATVADKQKILAATEAKKDPPATEAQKTADTKAVQDAQGELAAAKATRDEAAGRLKGRADTAAKSAAEVKTVIAAGGISKTPTAEVAEVLKGMQQQFLNTDFSEQLVAACLVELGLDPVVSNTEEDFFELLRKRVTNALIAVAAKPSDHHLQKIAADHLKIYEDTTIRFRKSRLSDYCFTKLESFIKTAQKDEVDLKKLEIEHRSKRIDVDRANALTKTLASFDKALASCREISDATQKGQCITSVTKMAAP